MQRNQDDKINDKRKEKVLRARIEHLLAHTYLYLHTLYTYTTPTNHRRMLLSSDTGTREDTCSRHKIPHASHNENKRVRCRSTRLIKNRSYQLARKSRSEKGEGG